MKAEDAIDDLNFIIEEEIEIQRQEEKRSDEQMAELRREYRDIFLGSAAGKRVLADLLNETGFFESSFSKYSAQTFYNEGKRDIGVMLMDNCFNLKDRKKRNGE
jgi:hypothetical protein